MQTQTQPTSVSRARGNRSTQASGSAQPRKTADEIWADEHEAETKRQLDNLKDVKPLDAGLIPISLIKSLMQQYPQK